MKITVFFQIMVQIIVFTTSQQTTGFQNLK